LKSLITLIRIIIVGLCWSLFFFEGIRVILLTNWHFDLIDLKHWKYVWDLWLSGWIIDDQREIAFILIIFSFIPLWLTGWASLSLVKWEEIFAKFFARILHSINKITNHETKQPSTSIKSIPRPTIKRKKSYKEIRPRGLSTPITSSNETTTVSSPIAANRTLPNVKPITTPPVSTPTQSSSILDHALFKLDNDDNDFDLSFDDLDKIDNEPKEKNHKKDNNPPSQEKNKKEQDNKKDKPTDTEHNNNRSKDKEKERKTPKSSPNNNQHQSHKNSGNSSLEILKQKGYQVISSATIKNNFVDFIGVAEGQICICIVDKESGDWLADEERFNDEEPLWFSESSHRISPVRCADIVQNYLSSKLNENGIDYNISTFVIIQYGNIINAEDMFETWENMHIKVTRIDRGSPRELKLFAKSLDDADKTIDTERFEKIKKIVRNLA